MKRDDDFDRRRAALRDLDDDQLEGRFWKLADEVVKPLIDLAHGHTSPSIERSVLLRMGFSSLEAKDIVRYCQKHGLLGKGAGHVILRLADRRGLGYREAGLLLAEDKGWDEAADIFGRELPS
ncbi:MAG: ornithine aminomutase subunit alpha [Dethiobacter sp.]|nr:ornithine aminomutase subunit alpha [Dethiobacter sp.]